MKTINVCLGIALTSQAIFAQTRPDDWDAMFRGKKSTQHNVRQETSAGEKHSVELAGIKSVNSYIKSEIKFTNRSGKMVKISVGVATPVTRWADAFRQMFGQFRERFFR